MAALLAPACAALPGAARRLPLHSVVRRGVTTAAPAAAAPPAAPRPRLVREFIHDALYSPAAGYFVHRDVIYAPPSFIDFNNLLGKAEYTHTLAQLYAASPHAWLTPVLVFQPHYSVAIARWLVRQAMAVRARGGRHAGAPLVVYEVGGGTGTNAVHILDYLRAHAPHLYRGASYTILEISPTLAARQAAALGAHAGVARSVVADATDLAAAGVRDARPCCVVACEVLDNLPHDKAVRVGGGREALQGAGGGDVPAAPAPASAAAAALAGEGWHEVVVVEEGGPPAGAAGAPSAAAAAAAEPRRAYREALRPLADATLAEALPFVLASASAAAAPGGGGGLLDRGAAALRRWALRLQRGGASTPHDGQPLPPGVADATYVPTGALRLLRSLAAAFPSHGLWLADFDALPPPSLDLARAAAEDHAVGGYFPAARLAPLVASKGGPARATVDHPTYLSPRPTGIADVFFPTDFDALAAMARHVRGGGGVGGGEGGVTVVPSGAFMARHADVGATRTLSGFNPLLEDYRNTRVLVADVPPAPIAPAPPSHRG